MTEILIPASDTCLRWVDLYDWTTIVETGRLAVRIHYSILRRVHLVTYVNSMYLVLLSDID